VADVTDAIPEMFPDAQGDLGSLGFNEVTSPAEKANLEVGVESEDQESFEEIPPEQSMPSQPEPVEQVEATAEAEPGTEEPQSLIDQYRQSLDSSPEGESSPRSEHGEESELSRLRQQVSRMEGELKARAEQLDRAITGQQEAKPQAKSPALDPAVVSMLHRIQEEAPEKLPEALATVADYVAEQKVESKVAELNKKFEAYENKTSQTEQTLQFRQQFNAGLEQAKGNLGGVYAEVVEDFNRNQENSLLFRKLVDNPYLLGSPVEAVKAVGTDIQLWKSVPKQDAPAQQSEPGGSAQTAVSGSASERGLSINEPKPEAPDEAEVLFNSIQGAHTPSLPWE